MEGMRTPRPGSLIVSARSIEEGLASQQGGPESDIAPSTVNDPVEQAHLQKRFDAILRQIKNKTLELEPSVLVTLDDRTVARFQSFLAKEATTGKSLDTGGEEAQFGTGFGGGDKWGWIKSLLDWVSRTEAHPMKPPKSSKPENIGDTFRVAMVADWGTGLYGAPVSANTIRRTSPYDLLLHLGDVYYSGTPEEVQERFLAGCGKTGVADDN